MVILMVSTYGKKKNPIWVAFLVMHTTLSLQSQAASEFCIVRRQFLSLAVKHIKRTTGVSMSSMCSLSWLSDFFKKGFVKTRTLL